MSVRGSIVAVFAALGVAVGGLGCFGGVALAAAPEAPVSEAATGVSANEATLHGELNPGAVGKSGWYFAYNTGGSCTGGGRVGGGEELEGQGVKVESAASGLEPGTLYTFCLFATNEAGEETDGSSRTFETAVSQPVVDSQGASDVGPFGATLEAQVDPEKQETNCVRFEYGTSAVYGSSVPCANPSLGNGFGDQGTTGSLTGLRPGTEYHFRVVVENLSSPLGGTVGSDQTFKTPAVLGGEESFSEVTEKGAILSAPVDAGGVPTTYYFQYGQTAAYGSRTPGATLSGSEAVGATARLGGLAQDSEYHFRIVTESENGVSEVGADSLFRTLPAGVQGLPDGRVYEMVTPPENQDANVLAPQAFGSAVYYNGGGVYGVPSRYPVRAAADGDAVAYIAEPTSPNGAGIRGFGETAGNDYIASRSASGRWTQVNLQPTGSIGARYSAFSSDLSTGILVAGAPDSGITPPPLVANAPQGVGVMYTRATDGGTYSPLFTTTPPDESGGNFGRAWIKYDNNVPYVELEKILFAGASADFSRLLFEANDALSPEAINGGEGKNNLYVSTGGSLSAVNILPGAATSEPNAAFGGAQSGGTLSGEVFDFSHIISADGSRIYWTDLNAGPDEDHIFVRENGTSTVAVSAGSARYWTASADGGYAFYTEDEQLFRFDVKEETREMLTSVGAEVQGVLGASENGSYIYFAADGVLASGAQPGQPNLYLLHYAGGGWEAPRFIATLQPGDGDGLTLGRTPTSGELPTGDWAGSLGRQTAEVTPDGQSLVFMSKAGLPAVGFPRGYDSNGLAEVYVYQAGEGGHLSCASCNPSGEPPQPQYIENAGVAAFLPVEYAATYQPRWISENGGRVFFDSLEPLVARDKNGLPDVYEWERDGEGSCTQSSGCIYLLSSGTGSTASFFIDASASGDDAFIVSADSLVPQDQNENADLYDARVGGVNLVPPAAGCAGAGCRGATSTSSGSGAPASETFTGAGNLEPSVEHMGNAPVKPKPKSLTRAQKLARALNACASGPRRQRVVCERRARRLYGPRVRARKTGVSKRSTGEGRS